ncbi:hypothetical protein ACJQWK_10676 [Exserohilum turcicum]
MWRGAICLSSSLGVTYPALRMKAICTCHSGRGLLKNGRYGCQRALDFVQSDALYGRVRSGPAHKQSEFPMLED